MPFLAMFTNLLRVVFSILTLIIVLISCKSSREGRYVDSTLKILNQGFEEKDSLGLPVSWEFIPTEGYHVALVSDIKHSGSYSLKIEGESSEEPSKLNFTQQISLPERQLKRIKISVFVKTGRLKGVTQLWYKSFDANNNVIDLGDSELFGTVPDGTNEWKEVSLEILLDEDAVELKLGLHVQAEGTVWFDDLSIIDYEQGNVQANEDFVQLNREFTEVVKNNSIYKDTISWEPVEKRLKELRKYLRKETDVILLNNYVLQQLRKVGDNHSFIQSKVAHQKFTSDKMVQPKPNFRLIDKEVAYISIPSFNSSNKTSMEEFASSLHNQIRSFDLSNNIKGWIVDLRGNSGGNMYPMLAGLAPLLDTGALGHFVMDKKTLPWSHTANAMDIHVREPYQIKNSDVKVAVIIGPRTGSSGEMTAISFIGQKNAKLFGEPSAGYTTSNQMFNLSNGSNLFLATGYVTDRNDKKYTGKIVPEVWVKSNAPQDYVLNIAKTWLLKK